MQTLASRLNPPPWSSVGISWLGLLSLPVSVPPGQGPLTPLAEPESKSLMAHVQERWEAFEL
jgi:hypothetical protein